jgi:hypothetical protein
MVVPKLNSNYILPTRSQSQNCPGYCHAAQAGPMDNIAYASGILCPPGARLLKLGGASEGNQQEVLHKSKRQFVQRMGEIC